MGIFNTLVIAISGTLPHEPKQIRSWIERNGGRFSPSVTKGVTHMLASKEAYKAPTPVVQQAADLDIPILSYDWFDDSLQARRKLGTKKYLWETIRKERKKRREMKKLGELFDGKMFREGCQRIRELTGSGTSTTTATATAVVKRKATRRSRSFFFASSELEVGKQSSVTSAPATPFVSAKEDLLRRRAEREAAAALEKKKVGNVVGDVNPSSSFSSSSSFSATSARPQAKTAHWKDEYHYYQDVTGFDYKIVLARIDHSSNSMAQYHVGLLESHAKPHVYWAIAQYKPAKPAPPTPDSDDEQGECNKAVQDIKPEKLENVIGNDENGKELTHPELTRLTSLVTKSPPSSDTPYTGELCPRNTSFPIAMRAFRHAFRDLTLLSWEERFADPDRELQKARAQRLNVEPFLYSKPKPGLPMGLLPQAPSIFTGDDAGVEARGDIEDGYVRGSLGLPGLEAALSGDGTVGQLVEREREEREKLKEEEEAKTGVGGKKGKAKGKVRVKQEKWW